MNPRVFLAAAALGVVAALAGAILARALSQPPAVALESGTWLPAARPVSDFQLNDLSGHPFDRKNLEGHPTLLFFGFTNCPDVCPTTLATLEQVLRQAPLAGTQVVFVSVDPE